MVRILVINGPNLNLLGERDRSQYGDKTLEEINRELSRRAEGPGVELVFFQSNHEGGLIDKLHEMRSSCRGVIINPGALTHYSYALRDAIEAVALPTVEVHLSNIYEREEWRRESVVSPVAWLVIVGKGPDGYYEALEKLATHLHSK